MPSKPPSDTHGKIYCYARVTPDRQEKENSLDAQSAVLTAWAADQDGESALLVERNLSAATQDFKDRPVGRKMARALKRGDTLAAVRLDRLLRRPGEVVFLEKLAARGVKVVTISDHLLDSATLIRRYVRGVLVFNATIRNQLVASRTREVMAYRKTVGLPCNGRPRYGQKRVRLRRGRGGNRGFVYVTDETERRLIGEAARRRMEGESCAKIAARFDADGLTTPDIDPKTSRPRPWTRFRVSRVTQWFWREHGIEPPAHAVCDRPPRNRRSDCKKKGKQAKAVADFVMAGRLQEEVE